MKIAFRLLFLITLFVLFSCNKDSDNEILGSWKAVSITYEDGEIALPDAEYLLTFENPSQYRLQLDINNCFGEISFNNNTVEFPDGIGCTEACCDSDFAISLAQELPQTQQWEITANQLLFSNDMGLQVVFKMK